MRQYINTKTIYNGIVLGTKKISACREELNSANKFPVPDNDTGDNLHYLMSKIRDNLHYEPCINKLLGSLSELAVMYSRGNSGAIFSQFFVGLEHASRPGKNIALEDLIHCFEEAYRFSHQAINNPILEGTILSAIKTWSDSLRKHLNKAPSMTHLYKLSIRELQSTVDNTKHILKPQKKDHICDAGALAFLYFIEGFMSAIVGETASQAKQSVRAEIIEDESAGTTVTDRPRREEHVINHVTEDTKDDKTVSLFAPIARDAKNAGDHMVFSTDRFCTEVLLEKTDRICNRNELASFGSSMVVSESKNHLRLHIHTNHPAKVTAYAEQFGRIIESKCDDMKVQSIDKKIGQTALLIDSIADIPESLYSEDTYMLPVNLLVDNVSFQDKRTMFPRLLEHQTISSSLPTAVEVQKTIDKLLVGYDHILILTVSSKMSGIYNQYKKILHEYDDKRITLIDTKLNSVAEGLVVQKALTLVKRGVSGDELLSQIQQTAEKTRIFVSLKTIDRMILSGRLNEKAGRLLQFIQFLPIIGIDKNGEGCLCNVSFSEKRNRQKIIQKVAKESRHIEAYAIVHCDCEDDAKAFAKALEHKIGFPPLYISSISSVVQNFSGKGSIAVGYTLK